jgi:hypothetical protein
MEGSGWQLGNMVLGNNRMWLKGYSYINIYIVLRKAAQWEYLCLGEMACFTTLLLPMPAIGLFGHHAFLCLLVEIGFVFWFCHIFLAMHLLYLGVPGILVGAPWYAVQLHIVCTYLNQLSPVCAGALLTSHDWFQV